MYNSQACFTRCDNLSSLLPRDVIQSLSGIDDRVTHMRVQVQQLDEEVRGMVRGQANSGHDGGVALAEAHLAIQELRELKSRERIIREEGKVYVQQPSMFH